jgi:hypothetical protein
MPPAKRNPTLIVKTLSFAEAARVLEDDRERDSRPGRFVVTGPFIQLPERETADRLPRSPQRRAP